MLTVNHLFCQNDNLFVSYSVRTISKISISVAG